MKKTIIIKLFLALILVILVLPGCGLIVTVGKDNLENKITSIIDGDDKDTEVDTETDTEAVTSTEGQDGQEQETGEDQEANGNSGGDDSSSRSLSQAELDEFTAWAQDGSNYGLLLSNYTDPTGADLGQALYCGGGTPYRQLTNSEMRAFLAITGQDEIYTDVTALTSAEINNYTESKLGISFESVRAKFDWVYLSQTDTWAFEHGDTNYIKFYCIDGKIVDGNKYVLEFDPKVDSYSYYSLCETTLVEKDGDYMVLSNVFKNPDGSQKTTQNNDDYVIDGYDVRYITKEEIQYLSKEDLRIARNEIYARHGRQFTSTDLQQYFNNKTWYSGSVPADQFSESVLNQYEKANLIIIKEVEDSK